jgi:hypothetical protein
MDFILAGGGSEEQLVESLDFSALKPSANYVTNRRSTQYYPQGQSTFSASNGANVARITLGGSDGSWIDPSTLRICWRLHNLNTSSSQGYIQPVAGSHCFINRLELRCNGCLLEDLHGYGRLHEMLSRLKPRDWRTNEMICSGGVYDREENSYDDELGTPIIDHSAYLSMSCKPFLGVMGAGKYLPTKYAPLTLEIHFATPADAVFQNGNLHPAGNDYTGSAPEGAPTSNNYELDDVHIKCDVVTLDSALDNSLLQVLMSGKALTWSYTTYYQQVGLLSGSNEASVTLSRAVTRLKSLFLTFMGEPGGTSPVIEFRHPSRGMPPGSIGKWSSSDPTFTLQCALGNKLFPELPCKSVANFWEHLRKAVDVHDTSSKSISIRPQNYLTNHFISAFSMEKVPGAGFSGLNTKSGDAIRLELKGLLGGWADRFFVTIASDNIVEIRESSVSRYE